MSEQSRGLDPSSRPARTGIDPVMRTPAHRLHSLSGARFERLQGWEIPAAYGPVEVERAAIREGLAIADVTPRGKVDVRGPVDDILAGFTRGSEEQVARISAGWALLLTSPGGGDHWLPIAERAAGPSGMATDATSLYTGIALLGPIADQLLARLTAVDTSTLGKGDAVGLQLARIPALLMFGTRAIEIYAGSEYGRYLWRTIAALAGTLGGRPVGWEALAAEGWS
ncbi:MAG TPA: hypothetical protein VIN39_00185 [Candidatus Dormibacteraeota bacterium]